MTCYGSVRILPLLSRQPHSNYPPRLSRLSRLSPFFVVVVVLLQLLPGPRKSEIDQVLVKSSPPRTSYGAKNRAEDFLGCDHRVVRRGGVEFDDVGVDGGGCGVGGGSGGGSPVFFMGLSLTIASLELRRSN